jgi:diketogulonate reductase-like aldo/keto reductase
MLNRRDAIRVMSTSAAVFAAAWGSDARRAFAQPASPAPTPPPGKVPVLSDVPGLITRPIPSTGEKLPVIGLGTWQVFDVEPTPEKLAPLEEVLRIFVEMGGSMLDSSPMYGKSEAVAGQLISRLELRPRLFVATKVWTTGREKGIEQMEESEEKLKSKPLDLMQVHNLVDLETHLETLRAWKKEGRFRYIGLTHYTASKHAEVQQALEKHPVDFVQINYSVGEREAEEKLLPFAKDTGIAVIANRPFVSGAMFKKLSARPIPEWASEIDCDSWAQLMLKFAVSHPAVTCAIPATSKASHMRDNMKACVGRLPDDALRAKIAEAVA